MSGTRPIKLILAFFLITAIALPLFANPFLSGNDGTSSEQPDEKQIEPVRPPSIQGPRGIGTLQLKLKEKLGEIFVPSENATFKMRMLLILISMAYGIIHALGPGHRKTIIFTLFLSQKTKWWEAPAAGFLAAGAHGGAGIVLILLLKIFTPRSILQGSEKVTIILEGVTYLAVSLVALYLVIKAVRELIQGSHHHHHGDERNKGIYATILTSSLFPCPGSILILLFSLSLGEIAWGIIAVIALSFGMGLTITAIAFLARTGREGFFNRLKSHEKLAVRMGSLMEGGAYLFLLIFSLWMAMPFALSLI